jgi:hypothetical protein
VEARAQAPLSALVFPRVRGGMGSYTLARLSPEAVLERLRAGELLAGVPADTPFAACAPGDGASARAALLARLAAELPGFDLCLDRDAFAGDPARLLDALSG